MILLTGFILTCILGARTLIDRVVKKTVSIAVNTINTKNKLFLRIDDVEMDVANGSMYLRDISIIPDKVYYDKFKRGETPQKMLSDVRVSEIALTLLDFKTIFWDKKIDSTNILVKNLRTNIYLKKHGETPEAVRKESSSGLLDSLHIKGLVSIDLGPIKVDAYQLNLLDADSKDTISSFSGDFLELDGVDLEKPHQGSDVFELRTKKIEVTLKDQSFKQAKSDIETTLGSLEFKNSERSLLLKDLRYRPIESLEQMASQRKYADNLFDVHVKSLNVAGLSIDAYRENHLGNIENILVEGMELKILKNKQKPENTGRRPLLPQQRLKNLDYPIHIEQVLIKNSSLTYKEVQPKDSKDILIANLTHLYAEITNVTSIKDSLGSDRPLTIAISSKLLDKTDMDLTITIPYNNRNDAFHYKGSVGSADLTIFNPLLIPAANIAIEQGNLESIHFEANATPFEAIGKLTMRYSHLKVDIPSKNKDVEHALSFLASSVIHKVNPKKNGKVRVAEVYYNRPPYKGMGGQITKSVLSGVINTISPLGKQKRNKTKKHIWFKKKKRP